MRVVPNEQEVGHVDNANTFSVEYGLTRRRLPPTPIVFDSYFKTDTFCSLVIFWATIKQHANSFMIYSLILKMDINIKCCCISFLQVKAFNNFLREKKSPEMLAEEDRFMMNVSFKKSLEVYRKYK